MSTIRFISGKAALADFINGVIGAQAKTTSTVYLIMRKHLS